MPPCHAWRRAAPCCAMRRARCYATPLPRHAHCLYAFAYAYYFVERKKARQPLLCAVFFFSAMLRHFRRHDIAMPFIDFIFRHIDFFFITRFGMPCRYLPSRFDAILIAVIIAFTLILLSFSLFLMLMLPSSLLTSTRCCCLSRCAYAAAAAAKKRAAKAGTLQREMRCSFDVNTRRRNMPRHGAKTYGRLLRVTAVRWLRGRQRDAQSTMRQQ